MRIGTWNLAGRWSARHRALLEDAACDVWLLTEVPAALSLDGGRLVRSAAMGDAKSWAAIWSSMVTDELPSPHPAAALAAVGDLRVCCCILPWRGARPTWPEDQGTDLAALTRAALDRLRTAVDVTDHPVIWGGDWNHALDGREWAGSIRGREAIAALLETAGLTAPTARSPHRIEGLLSIDHIAVPSHWEVASCRRLRAEAGGRRLSDHDAYVVAVARS